VTVKVSPKYQVVIPEEVRRQAHIKAGMEVTVLTKGGIVYVVPLRKMEDIARSLHGKFTASDLKNMREKEDR